MSSNAIPSWPARAPAGPPPIPPSGREGLPSDKPAWRAAAQEVLRCRSAQARTQHRQALEHHVLLLAQQRGARLVAIFTPLGAEAESRDMANALLAHGFSLAFPRLLPDGSAMQMVPCAGPAALRPRPRTRLLEPEGPACAATDLDMIVVPTLAISPELVRLGHGGGHYERYLPTLRADCTTIAAVATGCVWQWGPQEPQDCRMQLACTERGLFGAQT